MKNLLKHTGKLVWDTLFDLSLVSGVAAGGAILLYASWQASETIGENIVDGVVEIYHDVKNLKK